MGFFEWLYADEEKFIDLNTGIYYEARGKTRSLKGMFKNFDLPQRQTDATALKVLQSLVESGRVSKQEVIDQIKRLTYDK